MHNIQIRLANESDQEAIDAINRCAWAGSITTHELLERRHGPIDGRTWDEHIVEAVSDNLAQPDVTAFVAVREGQVVGYATAQIQPTEEGADLGVVGYNAVHPDHQGHGIGTALVKQVLSFLKAEGARVLAVWTLEADEPARHMYEKLGFEKLARFVYYSVDA